MEIGKAVNRSVMNSVYDSVKNTVGCSTSDLVKVSLQNSLHDSLWILLIKSIYYSVNSPAIWR